MKYSSELERSNRQARVGVSTCYSKNGDPENAASGGESKAASFDAKQQSLRTKLLALFAIACFLVAAMIATSATGQNYESIQVNPNLLSPAAVARMKGETRSMSSTGSGDGRVVRVYFAQYIPAAMTAADGMENMSEIVDDVTGYLGRANRGSRPEVAAGLTSLAFASMSRVATGNHQPAARIAAAVILGDLVSKPVDASNRRPQVPLAKALPILISLYEDTKNVDGLRAAALQGIHKHAMYAPASIAEGDRKKTIALMNDLLDQDTPAERDPKAHAFLQRYAVDVLDFLSASDDAALGMKLVSLSTEPKYLEMIALHSASRLAKRTKAIENKVDNPRKVLASWTTRTLTAFENEIERIESMERRPTQVRQPQDPSTHLRKPEERKPNMRGSGGRNMAMGMGGADFADIDMMNEMGVDDMGGGRGMRAYTGMDDGMMMDEMGVGGMGRRRPTVVQDAVVTAGRRKLNHVLQQVHLAVTGLPKTGMPTDNAGGLLGISDEATKADIGRWAEEMVLVSEYINDLTIEKTPEFLIVLQDQIEPLQELISSISGDGDAMAPAARKPGRDGVKREMDAKSEMSEEKKLEAALMAEPVLQ